MSSLRALSQNGPSVTNTHNNTETLEHQDATDI